MRNMKDVLINKIGESFPETLGELSIKLSEQAMGKCLAWGAYEPKISIELLKENIKK